MNFVIIGSTRTGSTMLDSALNNCRDINSFGECLNVKQYKHNFLNPKREDIKYIRQFQFKHSLYIWYKNNNPNFKGDNIRHLLNEEFIQEWFDWLYSLNKTVGWKLLWNTMYGFNIKNNAGNLQDVIYRNNIKVIHLKRNTINRIKSMRNKWGKKFGTKTDDELIEKTKQEQDDLKRWFPERLEITFEELTNDKDTREFPYDVTKKIFDYLELPYQVIRPIIKRTVYGVENDN